MSQLQTQILHQDYLLTCPDGQEAQLLEAVERVDQQFQQMRDTTKLRSRERICVLLSVNLAFENLELRQQLQTLQQQLASAQGNNEPPLSDTDTERLQALEAQTIHDQSVAVHLQNRLDQVLLTDAITEPDQQAEASTRPAAEASTTDNADLDNAKNADLLPGTIENL